MGIIGDIIRGVKPLVRKAKGTSTQQPTIVAPTKTLNETIEEQEQASTLGVDSFPNNTLNNQITIDTIQTPVIQNLINQNTATLSAPTVETQRRADIWAKNNIPGFNTQNDLYSEHWQSINEEIDEQKKEEAKNNIFDKIGNAYTRYKARTDFENEIRDRQKRFIVDYDPRLNRYIQIIPKDEGAFNARLEQYVNEANNATTLEEWEAAKESFYNDVKDDFRTWQSINTKYTDNVFNKIFNQEDFYSRDRLSSVTGRNIDPLKIDYPISKDEFDDYLEMLQDNDDLERRIYKKYKDDMSIGLDEVDLEETEASNEFMQRFSDIAKKDTLDLINRNITSTKRGEAIRNVDEIVSDPADRLLTSEMYLKKLRDEAVQTPESQRTQWQRDIIYNYDVVWKQLVEQYASNVNDYLMLQLTEGVDDKGEISDALWKFEDGSKLNDILRNRLAEIAGIDIKGTEIFGKVSALDIMRRFANEAAYEYRQGKTAQNGERIKNTWNEFEHLQEPIGERWAEAGQSVWRLGTKIVNTVVDAFSWKRGWNSPAAAYWDADFSVGKLIETDDSLNKRTVKKYGLQFGEYVPEGVGALAPDIALTIATSGGSIPSLLRSAGGLPRRLKRFKGVNRYLKQTKTIARTLDKTLTGLERVEAIGKEWGNINSATKRIWNIADRSLSQFVVGQSMDAKLSAFDTEPYSDISFWLSMGGSLLGDILPEAKDIRGVMRTGAKGGKARTKGTGVWDLVDFINQSDENAMLIARQMGKNTAEFSEQDLKNYIRTYAAVTDAAKSVYEKLPDEAKAAANQWTKELMYNYIKQAYQGDTAIGKAVGAIVKNKATNPADIIKYIGGIPGTVSVGPYQSRIRLKQGTLVGVQAKDRKWYNIALDAIDGGFGHKVSRGFTFKDLQDMSKIEGYEDVLKNREKYFRKVTEKVKKGGKDTTQTRWILSEDGLEKFGLETKNLTLASLGIEISDAENVKEIFKEKMKELEGVKLSEGTIDALAENGGYNEVVSKIENILC